MDPGPTLSLLDDLDDQIDDLEDSVAPFLEKALPEVASKLPLLDKAKLYCLVTYAIESILFSYLRLNGVKAREHPVFKELSRVKQYFDKIKNVETPVSEHSNLRLDKGAAARFIKAGLSGNSQVDLLKAEKEARERARQHIRFEDSSKKRKVDGADKSLDGTSDEVKAEALEDSESESDSSDVEESGTPSHKKMKTGHQQQASADVSNTDPPPSRRKARNRKNDQKNKAKQQEKGKKNRPSKKDRAKK